MKIPDLEKLCSNLNSKYDPLKFYRSLIQTMTDAKNLKDEVLYDPDSDLKKVTSLETHK